MAISIGIGSSIISLLSLIYDNHCEHCGIELHTLINTGICSDCWTKIKRITEPFCSKCGTPFNKPDGHSALTHKCTPCMIETPKYACARSAAIYDAELRHAIHSFKFKGNFSAGKKLAGLLHETFLSESSLGNCDLVSFVPLHRKRKKQRGFNQSQLLAKWFCKNTGLQLRKILNKRINTPPQTLLHSSERQRNIKNAFTVISPETLKGKSVLLIDDIYTTGSTIGECSRTMLRSGAKQIFVLTVGIVLS